MQKVVILIGLLLLLANHCTAEPQQQPARSQRVIAPKSLHWTPFLPGADVAVLQGDPKAKGTFTIRIHARAGTTIPPHSHPTDENITVLSGSVRIGMGSRIDNAHTRKMASDAFVTLPKDTEHYIACQTDCTIQIHGDAPFVVNFVNNDRPREDKTAK